MFYVKHLTAYNFNLSVQIQSYLSETSSEDGLPAFLNPEGDAKQFTVMNSHQNSKVSTDLYSLQYLLPSENAP